MRTNRPALMPGLRPSRWIFVLPFPDLTVGAISFRRFAAVFALPATHSIIGVAGEACSTGYDKNSQN
jgi:hypothetical protein